jgi:hypothetical protein
MKDRRLAHTAVAMTLVVVLASLASIHSAAAQGFASVSNLAAAAGSAHEAPDASNAALGRPSASNPAVAAPNPLQVSPSPTPAATSSSVASVTAPAVEPVTRVAAATGAVADSAGASPSVGAGAMATSTRASAGATAFEEADKVLVVKHERRLYLQHNGRTIAEYPVKLGLNPYGHKQQEGDFRTPEGKYELVRRNPRSDFFLSILVSYPNHEDEALARQNGWRPGGMIMIHGQPNVPRRGLEFYSTRDWTDGCIALSNSDMVDVWLRTGVGLPIEIRP